MKNNKKEMNLFTRDDIGITCPRETKWEELKSLKELKARRFCDGCSEKIFYVGGYTKGEVMALQRKYGNNRCVAFSENLEAPVTIGVPVFAD